MTTITLEFLGIDKATDIAERLHGALGGLGSLAGGALKVGLAAGAAGFTALAAGAGVAFGAALDNEKIQSRLAQVIKSTGGAAGLTAVKANELAKQFMNLAGGSDDAVLAIQEIGLRAGTVSAEQMPAFIQRTLDLGQVLGSTEAAATLLARAQEDVSGAVGKAMRAGLIFTDAEKEQIKALEEAGDKAGAVEIFMNRIAAATGGAAAANAETMAGKWAILQGRLGEVAETIGGPLLTVGTKLFDGLIAPAIPVVESLAEALAGKIPEALAQAQNKFNEILPAIQPVISAAQNVAAAFSESMPMIQASVQAMADFVLEQINILSPTLIANISTTLNSLAEFWREHGDEVMAVVKTAFAFVATFIGATLTTISGVVAATMQIINGDWSGAWQTVQTTATTFMQAVLNLVGTDLETFISTWRTNFDLAKLVVTQTFTNILSWIRDRLIDFKRMGAQILLDMIAGINSIAEDLAESILGPIRRIIAKAKEILGIGSPSGVMREIGVNMMQGLGEGLSEHVGWMADVMLAPLLEAAKKAQEIAAGIVTGNMPSLTPTLTPPSTPAFGGGRGITQVRQGVDMIVPPGFNENFMFGASSGEHVRVTPAGGSELPPITINVYAAPGMNEITLAQQVSSELGRLLRAQLRSGAYALGG